MDSKDIQTRVNALVSGMVAKGLREANAQAAFDANSEPNVYINWKDVTKKNISYTDREFKFFRAVDLETAFGEATAFIEALPSAEEARLRQFMGALANVIDLGKDNGVDVEFLNPLKKTMKKLSDNILTDQRAA